MSHEREIIDGKAQMAYAGETPWHGLGKRVPPDLSPEQMLTTAGLDWTVEKVPAHITLLKKGDKVETLVPIERHALVRSTDQKIIDVVTPDWVPLQNIDAFKFFDEYVTAGNMQMHTAGSLRGGQIVWALAKVNDSFELFGGDRVDSYLLFTNPHRYGQTIDVRFTPIRVVCNNTLTMALNKATKNMVKMSHRCEVDPEKVKEALGIAHTKMDKYKEMATFLGSKEYTDQTVKQYFKDIFPVLTQKANSTKEMSKTAELAYNKALEGQPGVKYAPNTWWQAFNAVSFLIDHKLGKTAAGRLESSWYGTKRNVKNDALLTAIDYATAA